MTDTPRLERVLGALRLSQQADGSTSIERQQEGIKHWAASPLRNARIIAWAEDPGVSGGLSPFKRPILGSWLTDERAEEWDTLAFLKIDRLSRRVAHFSEVLHWAQERGKSVVSVSEGIDMSTPMGKMFAQILAVFAEGELDTIKLRIEDAKNKRLDKGWWVAGLPSFGYTLERLGENKGKWLVQHPEYAELARGFAEAVMDDRSLRSMAKKLNEQGALTWQDTISVMAGKPARGSRWTADSIREVLKNPRIAGLFTYKGEVMEDVHGEPMMVTAKPILDLATWYSVVEKLEKNQSPARTTKSVAMLVGSGKCGGCGGGVHKAYKAITKKTGPSAGKVYEYKTYRCARALTSGFCGQGPLNVAGELVEDFVNDSFLDVLGDHQVMEPVNTQMIDPRKELEAVKARLKRLNADYTAGRYDSDEDQEEYWQMRTTLTRKRDSLKDAANEYEAQENKYRPTGQTWRELWEKKNDEEKQLFLKLHGATVKIFRDLVPTSRYSFFLDFGDIVGMAKAAGIRADLGADRIARAYNVPEDAHELLTGNKTALWVGGKMVIPKQS